MRLPRRQVPPGKNMRIYLSSSYNGFSRHNTIDYYDPSSQIKFSGELQLPLIIFIRTVVDIV